MKQLITATAYFLQSTNIIDGIYLLTRTQMESKQKNTSRNAINSNFVDAIKEAAAVCFSNTYTAMCT